MNRHIRNAIPLVMTIGAFSLLMVLGTWQFKRLEWKNALLNKIETHLSMPALNQLDSKTAVDQLLFREVSVRGQFIPQEFPVWFGTIIPGGKPGYDILVPLKLEDGRIVMVDRGWVPQKMKEPQNRPAMLFGQTVMVRGIILEGEKKPLFGVGHQVNKNTWFWIDLPAFSTQLQSKLLPYYIRELKSPGGVAIDAPYIKGDKQIRLRNDHLQYLIIWYSLAVAVVVIYVIYNRQQKQRSLEEAV